MVLHGSSTRLFYATPIFNLLDIRTVTVSPCRLPLDGDQAPAHLRAAVIVGHSDGRTYLFGVAGSDGFQGVPVPVGDTFMFSVADSDLGPVDLDPAKLPLWDTAHRKITADTRSC